MSDPFAESSAREDDQCAQWRRLGKRLWAGRRGLYSLGTVEWGRRFVWVDPDGRARGRYASLLEAQEAAEGAAHAPTLMPRSA